MADVKVVKTVNASVEVVDSSATVKAEAATAKTNIREPEKASTKDILAFFGKGKSAYEIAVQNGFEGTEQEWLDSLRPLVSSAQLNLLRPLAGKKILCLGDSIMGNDQKDGVPSYLAKYSGATVYNGGFGGSRFAIRTTVSDNGCFDLPNLLDAMISKDWTEHEERAQAVAADSKTFYYFPDTVEMLKGLDLSAIDIMTLAYGTNDWHYENYVGAIDYVVTAIKESIDKIQLNWPWIRILVITPIWRYFDKGTDGDTETGKGGGGLTLKEWVKRIEETAKDKRISVLNAYENMPLSRNNATTYFDKGSSTNDGLDHVHINEKGNQIYAQIIYGKLCSIVSSEMPDISDDDSLFHRECITPEELAELSALLN